MPMVIPVVAGAWTMFAAAGATMTIASGLAFAGGFLTVVGGISGDKDAMKLGGVLGLAGGLAGAFSGSAQGASTAASEAAAETASATAGNTVTDAIGNAATEQVISQAPDLAGAGNDLGLFNDAGIAGAAPGEGLISGAAPDLAGSATNDLGLFNDAGAASSNAIGSAPTADAAGLMGDQTKSAMFGDAGYGEGMSGAATSAFDKGVTESTKFGSLSDMFNSAESWMKQNPNMAKIGGGIIRGAADYMGDRQVLKDRMNAEKSYRDWVRQKYSDSVRNLVIPSPVSAGPGSSGIIAGQRG